MPYDQAYTRKAAHRQSKSVSVDISEKTAYVFVKRVFDILVSSLFLVILFPVFLVVAVLIRLSTGSGAFFCQDRIGRGAKPFKVYKFRTMKPSAPHDVPTNCLDNPDSYITRIGHILRKTSIDELPQLFNVLKGDMSIVGPRPLIEEESKIHALRTQNGVYQLRPGVTGWAQVNGRDYLTDEEKVALDIEYLRHFSFSFDLRCIWRTAVVVVTGRGFAEGRK